MSEMWNRTLVYLGLREEPEEMYDEGPERFDPEHDPHAEHAPERPRSSRGLVGAAPGPSGNDGRGGRLPSSDDRGPSGAARGERDAGDQAPTREQAGDSNVRALRTGDPHVRPVAGGSSRAVRVALVEVQAFEDVEAIGSRFRTGQPVLFDIVPGDRATGQRVVDFVSGLTYASRGRLTKVGTRAFLLVPDGVLLDDDEQRRLRGLGYRLPVAHDA